MLPVVFGGHFFGSAKWFVVFPLSLSLLGTGFPVEGDSPAANALIGKSSVALNASLNGGAQRVELRRKVA